MAIDLEHGRKVDASSGPAFALALALGALVLVSCGPTTVAAPSEVSSPSGPTTSTTTTPPEPSTTMIAPPTTAVPASTSTQPASTVPDLPLAGISLAIDPGHNGRNAEHAEEIGRLVDIGNGTKPCNTTGTASTDGYPESTFTWEVASVLRTMLTELGADVIMTRNDNDGWGPCITERAAIGNRADVAVSIHADGADAGERGFHVIHPAVLDGFTDDIAAESRRLAELLVEEMGHGTELPMSTYAGSGGLSERSDLGGLNLSDVPVVFLEAGNMKNQDDMTVLADASGRDSIARAVSSAIVRFVQG